MFRKPQAARRRDPSHIPVRRAGQDHSPPPRVSKATASTGANITKQSSDRRSGSAKPRLSGLAVAGSSAGLPSASTAALQVGVPSAHSLAHSAGVQSTAARGRRRGEPKPGLQLADTRHTTVVLAQRRREEAESQQARQRSPRPGTLAGQGPPSVPNLSAARSSSNFAHMASAKALAKSPIGLGAPSGSLLPADIQEQLELAAQGLAAASELTLASVRRRNSLQSPSPSPLHASGFTSPLSPASPASKFAVRDAFAIASAHKDEQAAQTTQVALLLRAAKQQQSALACAAWLAQRARAVHASDAQRAAHLAMSVLRELQARLAAILSVSDEQPWSAHDPVELAQPCSVHVLVGTGRAFGCAGLIDLDTVERVLQASADVDRPTSSSGTPRLAVDASAQPASPSLAGNSMSQRTIRSGSTTNRRLTFAGRVRSTGHAAAPPSPSAHSQPPLMQALEEVLNFQQPADGQFVRRVAAAGPHAMAHDHGKPAGLIRVAGGPRGSMVFGQGASLAHPDDITGTQEQRTSPRPGTVLVSTKADLPCAALGVLGMGLHSDAPVFVDDSTLDPRMAASGAQSAPGAQPAPRTIFAVPLPAATAGSSAAGWILLHAPKACVVAASEVQLLLPLAQCAGAVAQALAAELSAPGQAGFSPTRRFAPLPSPTEHTAKPEPITEAPTARASVVPGPPGAPPTTVQTDSKPPGRPSLPAPLELATSGSGSFLGTSAGTPTSQVPGPPPRRVSAPASPLVVAARTEKQRVELLLRVMRTVHDCQDTRDIIMGILDCAYDLLQADRVSVFLVDPVTRALRLAVSEDAAGVVLPRGAGIVGSVAETGELVHLADAYLDDRFSRALDQQTGYRTKSLLAMPILNTDTGEVIAVIQAINKQGRNADPQAFSDDDVALMQGVADSAGMAIRKAQLLARAKDAQLQTAALVEVVKLVADESRGTSQAAFQGMVRDLLRACYKLLPADAITLYVGDAMTGRLVGTSLLSDHEASLQAAEAAALTNAGTANWKTPRASCSSDSHSFSEGLDSQHVQTPKHTRMHAAKPDSSAWQPVGQFKSHTLGRGQGFAGAMFQPDLHSQLMDSGDALVSGGGVLPLSVAYAGDHPLLYAREKKTLLGEEHELRSALVVPVVQGGARGRKAALSDKQSSGSESRARSTSLTDSSRPVAVLQFFNRRDASAFNSDDASVATVVADELTKIITAQAMRAAVSQIVESGLPREALLDDQASSTGSSPAMSQHTKQSRSMAAMLRGAVGAVSGAAAFAAGLSPRNDGASSERSSVAGPPISRLARLASEVGIEGRDVAQANAAAAASKAAAAKRKRASLPARLLSSTAERLAGRTSFAAPALPQLQEVPAVADTSSASTASADAADEMGEQDVTANEPLSASVMTSASQARAASQGSDRSSGHESDDTEVSCVSRGGTTSAGKTPLRDEMGDSGLFSLSFTSPSQQLASALAAAQSSGRTTESELSEAAIPASDEAAASSVVSKPGSAADVTSAAARPHSAGASTTALTRTGSMQLDDNLLELQGTDLSGLEAEVWETLPAPPGITVLRSSTARAALDFDWDVLELEYSDTLHCAMDLLQSLPEFSSLGIDVPTLAAWVANVASRYRDNAYHCWHHGLSVAHVTYLAMAKSSALRELLTPLQQFAGLTAALAHDVAHPGLNNVFLIGVCDAVALRYNDTSVLENYHAAVMCNLMLRVPATAILASLDTAQSREVRRIAVSAVLHTDMKHHVSMVEAMKGMPPDMLEAFRPTVNEDGSTSTPSYKFGPLDIVVHAADLNNPVLTHFSMVRKWAEAICKEFSNQAAAEAAASLPVSPFMLGLDTLLGVAKAQSGFGTFVCRPLWANVARLLPELEPAVANLDRHVQTWKDIIAQEESSQAQ